MKNLVIKYDTLHDLNIGDYIQSLAAKQYFNENEIVNQDRDELCFYNGDSAKFVYNCWFSAKPQNFPPSDDLTPIFRSFHLNAGISDYLLKNEENINYFKKFEPIGCRDQYSADTFKKYGIDAYFSSCLTTTLDIKYSDEKVTNNIYIVDVISTYPVHKTSFDKYSEILKILMASIFSFRSVKNIFDNLMNNNPISNRSFGDFVRRWIYCARTYMVVNKVLDKSSISNAIYLTHLFNKDDIKSSTDRFNYAESLLKKYSQAKLVLSSRIHCVLPCLGLKTPAIYFNQESDDPLSDCRKAGLIDMFNVISLNKTLVINNPFGLLSSHTKITNLPNYIEYADKLKKDILEFTR